MLLPSSLLREEEIQQEEGRREKGWKLVVMHTYWKVPKKIVR